MSGGLFEPESTPEQLKALERLETLLALIEGWVDEVVAQATKDRMPAAAPLAAPAGPPSRHLRRWSALSCVPASSAKQQHCGPQCAIVKGPTSVMRPGAIPT